MSSTHTHTSLYLSLLSSLLCWRMTHPPSVSRSRRSSHFLGCQSAGEYIQLYPCCFGMAAKNLRNLTFRHYELGSRNLSVEGDIFWGHFADVLLKDFWGIFLNLHGQKDALLRRANVFLKKTSIKTSGRGCLFILEAVSSKKILETSAHKNRL